MFSFLGWACDRETPDGGGREQRVKGECNTAGEPEYETGQRKPGPEHQAKTTRNHIGQMERTGATKS